MKKTTFSKATVAVLMLLLSTLSHAQNFKPFGIRYNKEIKGNMLLIGNNILGKGNNPLPANDNSVNENISMKYIDIDGYAATFSSSSADLKVPPATTCFRIAYAGLYWGALIKDGESRADISKIKLKLPGSAVYNDITGSPIYDANVAPIVPDSNRPYACYADVTSLLSNLASAQGTYTVANVTSSLGFNGSTGLAAGWTLFVVYEDPTATTKSITTFDGFSALYDGKTLNIPISGFTTPPGVIDILYGFATLGGDSNTVGSKTEINGKAIVNAPQRASNQFFNSTITDVNGYFTNRVPNSINTLGYDTGIESILGAQKSVISNGATNATITLQVAKGQANPVFSFFNAFGVDVIAPDIALTKVVKDDANNDIGGANVSLGDKLFYEISYQNVGNDNVTGFTIKDVLPKNIIFNYPGDIDLTNAGGATVQSYDPVTRTIIFKVPDGSVEINDPLFKIRIKVQVVTDCNLLSDACSNEIKNQAFASYSGVVSKINVNEEGSFASTVCNFGTGQSTNFLVGIDNCKFTQKVVLCGASVVLRAPNGYDTYSWSRSSTGAPVIGTGQTYTATQTGVYYVRCTTSSTCKSIDVEITVVPFGATITNPVIPFADQVVVCPNNGKQLPNIFLCGANATRLIKTGISDALSISWEKLDEATCPSTAIANCANENFAAACWKQVGTGADYLANTSGQFRVTLSYPGGCFSQFYFNVYQNLLNPSVTTKDITCNTKGEITVNGVPTSGYEFSLDNNGTGTYQTSNVFPNAVFPVVTAGFHTVYIKQVGVVTNPCIFEVKDVYIQQRVFTVTPTVTPPLCNGDKGSLKLAANGVLPQYYYKIYQGSLTGTLVNQVGPIDASDYTFPNLTAGTSTSPITYAWEVSTSDGCLLTGTVDLVMPDPLTAKANLTTALTCQNGLITVDVSGGTPPYKYYVNSTTVFQNTPQITVTNPLPPSGVYNIDVVDKNGCPAKTSITVAAVPKPEYTITPTNINCYGYKTGEIKFDVTNDNGYTLSYGIDKGAGMTYSSNPLITGLVANVPYKLMLKYSLNGVDCYDTEQTITLTEPVAALTASAGVSELAGCGPLGEGKIRITNPQGGTPFPAPDFYEYSFDGSSWSFVNWKYVLPGKYTLYIRDAKGCVYTMENIILEEKPLAPTIDVSDPVFNCNGSANSTVTVTNSGSASFSYNYLLDGIKNPNTADPKKFLNVPTGSHTISVEYLLTSVPTYSNLLNEDFGSGAPTKTVGIAAAYCFNDQHVKAPWACGTQSVEDNQYSVASFFWRNDAAWYHFKDHTTNGADPNGRYLLVNIGGAAGNYGVLYSKDIVDVIPNQPVKVELYVANLLNSGIPGAAPDFKIELVDPSGTVKDFLFTGKIAEATNDPNRTKWVPISLTLNPGNNTKLTFKIRSGSILYNGNDAVIDDIKVYQLPKSCVTKVDFPFEVASGKAFAAQITGATNVTCAGLSDGTITIAAQNFDTTKGFQYSIDNGANWSTQMTSPYTITGLANATYNVLVKYDTAGTCKFPFTQVITMPLPLKVDAKATPATCSGATVTASATDGTPGYWFQLDNIATAGIDYPFINNPIFNNVPPGTYVVTGRDASKCTDDKDVNLVIAAAATPTATIVQNTDLCFDPITGAKITVNVSGGVGPYSYQTSTDGGLTYGVSSATFDGPPFPASFTYTATATGTYKFKVTDSYGCFVETASQVINAKLTAGAIVSPELDCDIAPDSPDAVITVSISGGTSPFTYTVINSLGTPLFTSGSIAGPTFTYTTGVDDTYTFDIKDKNGCVTTTTAKVNPKVVVTAKANVTDVTCNGDDNGSVTLEGLTGAAPFTYSFNGVLPFSSVATYGSLQGTVAGKSYKYQVKDNKGCIVDGEAIVKQPDVIKGDITLTKDYTCDGPAEITVSNVSGGNAGGYSYTLNREGVAVAGPQSGVGANIFNNLSVAGNYTVTITDSKGCPFTTSPALVIAALNPPLSPTFTERPISCKPLELTSDVTVSITAGTGTGILKYETIAPSQIIKGQQTSSTFTGLTPGTYTFKVTDANNCSVTGVYTVKDVLPVIVNGSLVSNVSCKGSSDGKLTYTVSGNSGVFTYELKNSLNVVVPIAQSTQTGNVIDYTGLAADTYTITVTNPTTTCIATQSIPVAEPLIALGITLAKITPITCLVNGKVVINTVGGWGNNKYTLTQPDFSVVGPQSSATFTNLTLPGTYSISVTDLNGNGCTVTDTFVLAAKVMPSANIDATSNLCYDSVGKATIIVTPTVPSPTYMYSINGGTPQNNGTFANLNPGSYVIRVTDTNTGCYIDLTSQTIAKELTFNAVQSKSANCIGQDIEIKGTISGGTQPYTYTVTINGTLDPTVRNVAGTTFVFTDPTATTASGDTTYLFTLTDASVPGCSATSTVTVKPKTNPKITSATPVSSILCNGDATGSITVVIDTAFGVGPYVINVVKDNSPLANVNYGTQTSGLPAGTYIVTVTDAKGCTDVKNNVTITEPDKIVYTEVVTQITCDQTGGSGTSYGSIAVTGLTGGTPGYTYTLTSNTSATQTYNPVAKEDYTFTVLNFGVYELTVSDANGCSVKKIINMASPPSDLIIDVTPGAASCTSATLVVSVNPMFAGGPYHFARYPIVSGFSPPYSYPLNPVGTYKNADAGLPLQATFSGLNPGVTYSFIVYDESTKCYFFKQAEAPTKTASTLTSTVTEHNVTCKGQNDGTVSFTLENFNAATTDVKYEIFNSQTNLPLATPITGVVPVVLPITSHDIPELLAPGTYYILFTELDNLGNPVCVNASKTFTITQSVVDLSLTAKEIKKDNSCTTDAGQIAAIAKGGSIIKEDIPNGITAVPYLYQIVKDYGTIGVVDAADTVPTAASFLIASHTSNTFNKDAGNYLVYVRDAYGCIQVAPVTLGLDPTPVITAVSNQCVEEGKFAIDVNLITSGIGPHSYSLDGDAFITRTAPFTYTNLASGAHTVEVKDSNGCGNTVILPIISTPLDINASFTAQPTCKNADGTITAVVTGGFTPTNFEYTLVNNTIVTPNVVQLNDPVFLNQAAGNYTITVKDLNTNCTKSTTIDLLVPTDIVLDLTDIVVTSPNCTAPQGNISNGTIKVNLPAANDNPDYTYTLTPTAPAGLAKTQTTALFTGLSVGFYDVTVKSGRDCFLTKNVEIKAPILIVADATASLFTCSPTNALNATIVTVTGTGGAGTGAITDYKYSANGTDWKDANTFDVFDKGIPQNLTYYVKDANGCVDDVAIDINPFPKLISATASQDTRIDCINNNEIIKVDIVGGSLPTDFEYQVAVNGGAYSSPATPITAGTRTFKYTVNAAGSYYEFKITDKTTGCSVISNVYDVPLFDKINVVANAASQVSCNGDSTGKIEINVTGYTGTYDYEVYDGVNPGAISTGSNDTATANPFVIPSGLKAGNNYTVKVIETSAYPKCRVTSNVVVITEPAQALDISVVSNVNKNCNTAGAVVTVEGKYGTPGYSYKFLPSPSSIPDPATDYVDSETKTLNTLKISPAFDLWDVYVKDARGCIDVTTIQVTTDPMPTVSATVESQCADPAGYTINVVGTGVATAAAPLEYSLDGGSFQSGTSFIVTTPKAYDVTVRDANQCTATATAAVTILDPLGLRADITKIPTCNSANGEVTLTASGGSGLPNYEYSNDGITYSSAVSANVFKNLAPNTYTFWVRDKGTTCPKSVTVVIDTPNATINFGLSKTDATCKGDSDGTITVDLVAPTLTVNNNPIYTYTISPNAGVLTGNVFTNLPFGSYDVTVTSGRGCTDFKTIKVGEPAIITVPAPTVVQYGCNTGSNDTNLATITVTGVTGGSGVAGVYANYEFIKTVGTTSTVVYFGPSNVYTEADFTGGNYTVNVYDSKGCMGTAKAPAIAPFISIKDPVVVVNKPITCVAGEDITVTVSSTGGTPATLDYSITDQNGNPVPGKPTNQTGIFTGLAVGNYIITVSNPTTGCSIKTVHYVNEPNTFELQVVNKSDVVCFGSNEGSVALTFVDRSPLPTDESGPYSYEIKDASGAIVRSGNSTNAAPELITGLKAGTYSVTATLTSLTSPQCTTSLKNFTINQPIEALAISETHTEITCVAGNNDGTISASATGGWPGGYEFQLELGGNPIVLWSSVSEFKGLSSSLMNYTVRVRDSKLCSSAFKDVSLVDPTPIVATADSDIPMLSCNGDTSATITASATGGSGNYMYTLQTLDPVGKTKTIDNGPQQSNVFRNLGAGTYKVLVSDTWSCSNTSNTVEIKEPTKVVASLVKAATQTCANNLATLTLSATGGTGPYTYSVDPNFGTSSSSFATFTTVDVPVGTYHYYVKDAKGCVSYLSNDIKIDPLETLVINLENANPVINCTGDNNGVIIATALGGLGNYVYTLTNTVTGAVTAPQPTGNFTGLFAGTYNVHVDSGVDCKEDKLVTITESPVPLVAPSTVFNVTCNGNNDGKIVITASGGTGIIKYAISPDLDQFFDTNTFDNLAPDNYDVIVQDELGCYIKINFNITEPNPITPSTVAGSIVDEICAGDKDGEFKIDIKDGTAPYKVSLDKAVDLANPNYITLTLAQMPYTFDKLAGGDHTVYIVDANGCSKEWLVAMAKSINLDPIAIVEYGCLNDSPSNTVTVTLDASVNPADVVYSLDGGPTQTSEVFANVAPGKHRIKAIHANKCEKDTDDFTISQFDPLQLSIADGGLNEIVATTTGGAGGNKYTLNGEDYGSQSKFIIYKSGEYTVTVTDQYGCNDTAKRNFEYIDVCIPDYFTPNGDGQNDGWAPGCTINYKNLVFSVFDRYGRTVGTYHVGEKWDGKYNGVELPSGDYWYVLKLNDVKDAREFMGHFTLYR